MSNPFQEQFLKAGLVTKEQVKKANQKKPKKQQRSKKAPPKLDEATLKARQAEEKKAQRDRELNQKRQEQIRQRALSAEIDQLISNNFIKRDEKCDIAYNFEHRNKIHRIYVNAELKKKIVDGDCGIARIEGRYEVIPLSTAEKIQQRNEKRVVLLAKEDQAQKNDNDPYAEYQVPDDLMW